VPLKNVYLHLADTLYQRVTPEAWNNHGILGTIMAQQKWSSDGEKNAICSYVWYIYSFIKHSGWCTKKYVSHHVYVCLRCRVWHAKRLCVPPGMHPPGPPLARPILPRERGAIDRVVEYLVGDGPQNRWVWIMDEWIFFQGSHGSWKSLKVCEFEEKRPDNFSNPNPFSFVFLDMLSSASSVSLTMGWL